MAELVLTAETGRAVGTRPSRRLRRDELVPGVVYGLGDESTAVTVSWPELRRVLTTEAGLNALITLEVEGSRQLSIVTELQRHPVRSDVIHVDFLRIDPDAEIQVDVPITLTGEARLVTAENGMVDQTLFSLSVFSRPDSIPAELVADISELTVGDALRVSDLALPDGVRSEVDLEETIAVGMITRSTLETIALEEEAAAAAALAAEDIEGEDAEPGAEGQSGDGDDTAAHD